VPLAAHGLAQALHGVRVERLAPGEQHAHGRVLGERGALDRERERDRQDLVEPQGAADDHGRELADRVPEAELRLPHRHLEHLFQDRHLGQLHGHDHRDVLGEGVEAAGGLEPHVLDEIHAAVD
jgi:hypothetical protein